tara:strand:+ start:8591 stop:8788 length:198 start_codon:yes stop_codon:yes gene_type:complete
MILFLCQVVGLRPRIAEQTPHLSMMQALVANGFGYGLMNVLGRNLHAPDGKAINCVPISGQHCPL